MGLFQSLRTGLSGIMASQNAIRTTGHNISNAETPGYTRQRSTITTRTPDDMEQFQIGRGADVTGVERLVNKQLETRIQNSNSELSNLTEQKEALSRVEQIFNELSENDIGSSINQFFNSIQELSKSPEDASVRQQVVSNGKQLTEQVQFTANRLLKARKNLNGQIVQKVNEINSQTERIAQLNKEIVRSENGGLDKGTANDLRDRRSKLIKELSSNLEVRTNETDSGSLQVMAGGQFLVFEDKAEKITTSQKVQKGIQVDVPRFEATGTEVPLKGGALAGMVSARDDRLLDIQKQLDTFSRKFSSAFNQIHSEGVGLNRLTEVTSNKKVLQPALSSSSPGVDPTTSPDGPPLAADGSVSDTPTGTSIRDERFAGLDNDYFNGMNILVTEGPNQGEIRTVRDFDGNTGTFFFEGEFSEELQNGTEFQVTGLDRKVQNGSFDIKVTNESTGNVETFNIEVDLDGIGEDSDLQSIADEINSEVGSTFSSIQAEVTSQNRLNITSSSDDIRFRFDNDSSNFLAATGMNTFFSGSTAADLSVSQEIQDNPDLVAAAQSNTTGDNTNAQRLLGLREEKLFSNGTATAEDHFESITGEIGVDLQKLQETVENQETLNKQLKNQRERVSGVNLDEEAVDLIQFQRLFQSSSRYVSVVNEMFDSLLNAT